MLTENVMNLMNVSSNRSHRKWSENAIKENKRAVKLTWIDRKRFIFLMKHKRRQNEALVSFIGYKGTADWVLACILKWIADRLILYPNHRSIERNVNFSNALRIWRLPIGSNNAPPCPAYSPVLFSRKLFRLCWKGISAKLLKDKLHRTK